jgi:hypothetical protein
VLQTPVLARTGVQKTKIAANLRAIHMVHKRTSAWNPVDDPSGIIKESTHGAHSCRWTSIGNQLICDAFSGSAVSRKSVILQYDQLELQTQILIAVRSDRNGTIS